MDNKELTKKQNWDIFYIVLGILALAFGLTILVPVISTILSMPLGFEYDITGRRLLIIILMSLLIGFSFALITNTIENAIKREAKEK